MVIATEIQGALMLIQGALKRVNEQATNVCNKA
jgi:hypothetical protein